MSSPPHSSAACHEQASAWMHRGIDLLIAHDAASLREAVRCFDEAIALRRDLPLENPRDRYLLAGGWINRGDALVRLEENGHLDEAIQSYDQALELLRSLPLDDDSLYPRRLAIAWINRGVAFQQGEGAPTDMEARRCFRKALDVLKNPAAAALADLPALRAGVLTNLAAAWLDAHDPAPADARDLARQALALIKLSERSDVAAAEAGFKARYVLCRAIAGESHDGKSIPPELLTIATDAVDEGLALARHWEQRGEKRFRPLAEDLFRFGCRAYQTGQPHFLAEFILEHLDPEKTAGAPQLNPEMHETAVTALWSALREFQRNGFPAPSTPQFEHLLENLRDLRLTEERLEELRQTALSNPAQTSHPQFEKSC